jgi:hypothetical protein
MLIIEKVSRMKLRRRRASKNYNFHLRKPHFFNRTYRFQSYPLEVTFKLNVAQ